MLSGPAPDHSYPSTAYASDWPALLLTMGFSLDDSTHPLQRVQGGTIGSRQVGRQIPQLNPGP